MANQRLALSVGIIVLAAACFVIGCVAVAIPQWGHFRNRVVHETGNFGPWTICKDIDYGRQTCGARIVMFQPTFVVFAAGVCGAVGVAALGAYGLISILYLTVQSNPLSIRRYKIFILITKLIFSLVAALMTITAVGLFATQGDDLERGYIISVGFSFYMEVVLGLFTTILMLLTVGEYVTSRREPDVEVVDAGRTEIGLKGATIGNPGYRERATNGTISMTHSSGVPYSVSSVRFKSNHNNHVGHNPQGGSGRRRTPPNKRHSNNASFNSKSSSNRHKNGRPFSKDFDSSWNGSVNSVTTSPAGSTVNGSSVSDFSSVSTISTVVSTTPTRGPLRSSLKKSRTSEDGFGIPNPGFSGSSPTLSRTSSLKKVRIQSYTTDV